MSAALSHEKHLDMSKRDAEAKWLRLHDLLKARGAPKPGSFSALNEDEKREYFRIHRQQARAIERQAAARGAVKPTKGNIRDALADAALMLLATSGPGADQVRHVLATVFSQRPGVPIAVEHKAKNGKLRPKLVGRN